MLLTYRCLVELHFALTLKFWDIITAYMGYVSFFNSRNWTPFISFGIIMGYGTRFPSIRILEEI